MTSSSSESSPVLSEDSCDSVASFDDDEAEEDDVFGSLPSVSRRQPLGVQPYMFEPRPSTSADQGTSSTPNPPSDPYADRVGKNDWCTCGQCEVQTTSVNSFCCRECPQLDILRQEPETEEVECCIQHTGVQAVATNVHVLRAAYNSNRRKYGQRRGRNRGGPWTENEKHRHIAYGNVVALAWGWLGRANRVPLPACVMRMIREAFPSDTYTGYKESGQDS